MQHEQPPPCPFFILLDLRAQFFCFQLLRPVFVRPFFLRQIVEQLPDAGVLGTRSRLLVKTPGFHLHGTGGFVDRVQPERPHQPDRLPLQETPDILPPNQRNVFSEFLPIQLDQPPPVPGLFYPHAVKNGRGCGEVLTQAFDEIGVHPLVFFFQRNRQRQNFLFGKSVKVLHAG